MHLTAIKELMINLGYNRKDRETYNKLKNKIEKTVKDALEGTNLSRDQYTRFLYFVKSTQSADESMYDIMSDSALKLFDNGQQFTPRDILLMHSYFSKFDLSSSSSPNSTKLMNYLNQQINHFIEISTDTFLLHNLHSLLTLAATSSQYLSRLYNQRLDKLLQAHGPHNQKES